MKNEPVEVIRGSGNVYRDLGKDDADGKQFKALLEPIPRRPDKAGDGHPAACAGGGGGGAGGVEAGGGVEIAGGG